MKTSAPLGNLKLRLVITRELLWTGHQPITEREFWGDDLIGAVMARLGAVGSAMVRLSVVETICDMVVAGELRVFCHDPDPKRDISARRSYRLA